MDQGDGGGQIITRDGLDVMQLCPGLRTALVDVRLSEKRDMAAAKAFFRSAKAVTGVTPARVTTDGHDSYPRAIRTEPDEGVKHRTRACSQLSQMTAATR